MRWIAETYMVCWNTRTRRQTRWIAVGRNVCDITAIRSHVAVKKKVTAAGGWCLN